MKKNFITQLVVVFMFFFGSFWMMANNPKDVPVTVSPGGEQEVTAISQNCPTFSWSAVELAASYRVAVFVTDVTDNAKATAYEEMAAKTSPVVSKDIAGPALSWTLSSEESLKNGNTYVWYTQAVDAYGNAASGWSKGRIFKVKQEAVWVGIEEKLGQKLKEYGVSDDVIKNVMHDIDSEVKEVVVPASSPANTSNSSSIGRLRGLEDTYNTFYGSGAGANTTGANNAFFGAGAGYTNYNGASNSFFGDHAGNANYSGSGNIFLGNVAGYYNYSGNYNIFIGLSAGYNNTDGFDNVFIGASCGTGNISGSRNCFIGSYAGGINTGSQNTFLGFNCGYGNNGTGGTFAGFAAGMSNDTGNYNSFFGFHSGIGNISGSSNTFIGSYSGDANNSGNNNTFLGYNSGTANYSGNNNSFVGYNSGGANYSGGSNAFFGNNAGAFNYSGFNNNYFGYYAGYKNTAGYSNIAIGYQAGYDNGDGDYNTYVGNWAGYWNHGNGNVFLGCSAGYNEAGSNKLYIDNSITSSPLIYGDFSTDIIKINGSLGVGISPIYPLHVSNGAYCSYGGTWTNASSRSLKENIRELSTGEALDTLSQLNPVRYNYKVDKTDEHVGFIAEDVPDLVATSDRKGLSPMDITAVLTKVVQELRKENEAYRKENEEYRKLITDLQERMTKVEKVIK